MTQIVVDFDGLLILPFAVKTLIERVERMVHRRIHDIMSPAIALYFFLGEIRVFDSHSFQQTLLVNER